MTAVLRLLGWSQVECSDSPSPAEHVEAQSEGDMELGFVDDNTLAALQSALVDRGGTGVYTESPSRPGRRDTQHSVGEQIPATVRELASPPVQPLRLQEHDPSLAIGANDDPTLEQAHDSQEFLNELQLEQMEGSLALGTSRAIVQPAVPLRPRSPSPEILHSPEEDDLDLEFGASEAGIMERDDVAVAGSNSPGMGSGAATEASATSRELRLHCSLRNEEQRKILRAINAELSNLVRACKIRRRRLSKTDNEADKANVERAYSVCVETAHKEASKAARLLLDIRGAIVKGHQWHLRSGFFLDLPLAYYLAHSSIFLTSGSEHHRVYVRLGQYLQDANNNTPAGKGRSVDEEVRRYRDKHGESLMWLSKQGSISSLVRTLPRARHN